MMGTKSLTSNVFVRLSMFEVSVMREILKNEKGQALVEFALIIPLVFLLIFAMLETGRFVHAAYEVEHASRESVRLGALGGNDAEIEAHAIASASGIDSSQITVAISPAGSRASGDQITVTVTYQFTPITPFVGAIYGNGIGISADMSMRVE